MSKETSFRKYSSYKCVLSLILALTLVFSNISSCMTVSYATGTDNTEASESTDNGSADASVEKAREDEADASRKRRKHSRFLIS